MLVAFDHASVDGNTPPGLAEFQSACQAQGSRAVIGIMRANYGMSMDATFRRDLQACLQAGLQVGAYLFLRTPRVGYAATPEDQVHAFTDNVLGLLRPPYCLPPIVDVEEDWHEEIVPDPTGQRWREWLHRAWLALTHAWQVPPMIYTSNRVWMELLHNQTAGDMVDSPLWLAKPWPWQIRTPARLSGEPFATGKYDPPVPGPWGSGNWWLHQYQGDALPVPGFANTVDLSRFHVMAVGEVGPRVEWVQRRLGMVASGTFDVAMETRIRAFQRAEGVAADGVIGPVTFGRIAWCSGVERLDFSGYRLTNK